jgi:hypothetical protein
MSEMQSKNWCSQATACNGNGKSNWCSLLYLRVLETGISEIMMADRIFYWSASAFGSSKRTSPLPETIRQWHIYRRGWDYGEIRQLSV